MTLALTNDPLAKPTCAQTPSTPEDLLGRALRIATPSPLPATGRAHDQHLAQDLAQDPDDPPRHDAPPSHHSPSPQPPRTSLILTLLLIPLCLIALALSTSYILRSRAVSGPHLQRLIEREAHRRKIDLYIQDMRPSGLLGVRLERVRARITRGHYTLDTRVKSLEISPDLWASLRRGRLVPGTIHLHESDILIERSPQAEDDAAHAASPAQGEPSADARGSLAMQGLDELHIIGHAMRVQLKAGLSFSSTHPLIFQRVEARIPLRGDPLPHALQGYGKLPDQTPFWLTTSPDSSSQGRLYTLSSQHQTHLHHWFIDQLPFQMTTQQMTVCSGCDRDEITLGHVRLKLPNFGQGLDIEAQGSSLAWDRGKATLHLPGVQIQGISDPRTHVRLERTQFMFDTATGSHSAELALAEHQGGTLSLTWLWDGQERQLSGALEAQRFALTPFFSLWATTPWLQDGTLQGSLSAVVDLPARHVELHSDMALLQATGRWPHIAQEPLILERLHVGGSASLDLSGLSLSLSPLTLTLGQGSRASLQGYVQRLRSGGWAFELTLDAPSIDPEQLRQELPHAIRGVFDQSTLEGLISLTLNASGQTHHPETLRLRLDTQGQLDVRQDGPQIQMQALAGQGMPWSQDDPRFDPPTTLDAWTPLSALPPHVPRTITAAEDAQFYRHRGVDLVGLERAMVHNLRVGRMERGGSTISQQLVKNLFLSRERTLARKLQELLLTSHMEQTLGKDRILELYLNVAHWGPHMRGIGQAAQGYFQTDAASLSIEQTALLGAILPGPTLYGPQIKQGRIASSRVTKLEHILSNLRFLGFIEAEEHRKIMARAWRGQIAGLELTLCADDDTAPKDTPPCHPTP